MTIIKPPAKNPQSAITPFNLLLNIHKWQLETASLSPSERGALLALQMYFWQVGQIPDRDEALARIVGTEQKEWKRIRKTLEPLFEVQDGRWSRPDWEKELRVAHESILKAKEKSKKGHDARWKRSATGMPQAGHEHGSGTASGMLNNNLSSS